MSLIRSTQKPKLRTHKKRCTLAPIRSLNAQAQLSDLDNSPTDKKHNVLRMVFDLLKNNPMTVGDLALMGLPRRKITQVMSRSPVSLPFSIITIS